MISKKFCLIFAFSFLALATLAAEVRKYQEDFFILHNPCWYKHCHPYATCKVNGSEAICVCPSKCTRILRPVCGTNWRTYNNLCELIAKSCAGNEKTRYRYNGECKAGDCKGTRWEGLRCPYYSRCRLNYGLPSCSCPKQRCSYVYKPVCGTNGRTYRNSCFLREQACRNRRWLRIRHAGHCKPDPCNKLDCCCGAKCRVNEDNRATCECDILCPQIYQPVCGSDGKTYGNGCNLRSAACARQNPKLVESGFGPCLKPTVHPCAAVSCSSYAKCEVINGTGQCVCPRGCPEIYQPVCGSDHVTYSNECELNRTNCLQNKTTTVAKKGPCSPRTPTPTITPCATVKCGFYATCKVVRGQPRCTCSNPCPGVSDPVCGSDNHTYENECDLRRTSCKDQRSISLVKKGFCEPETSCPIPRICLVFCDEADCAKKGQICCCQGCGSVCTTPIKSPVSGLNVCPPDPLACRKDSDCSGGKKCCSIGCSTRCTSVKG